MNKIILLVIFLYQLPIYAQQLSDSSLLQLNYYKKEIVALIDGRYNPKVFNQNVYGDGLSYTMESLLEAYRISKDKEYLDLFCELAIQIQTNRNDYLGKANTPNWVSNASMYQDGLITWPMAHFVYLLQEDALFKRMAEQEVDASRDLFSENKFGINFKTYDQIATWLGLRIVETMNYYLYGNKESKNRGFWGDDTRAFTPAINSTGRAQVINMQAGFASTLYYIGTANQVSDFLHKARVIAKNYKGERVYYTPGRLTNCSIPKRNTAQVLELSKKNAYIWRFHGWRDENCGDNERDYNDYEDISHAVQSLTYVWSIAEKFTDGKHELFTEKDMQRFKNTFIYHIYKDNDSICPQFNLAVDGDNVINYESKFKPGAFDIRCLSFAQLAKYDEENTVLSIINRYYWCAVHDQTSLQAGMDFYGLIHLIKANEELNYYRNDK